jgi:hypothetical protein
MSIGLEKNNFIKLRSNELYIYVHRGRWVSDYSFHIITDQMRFVIVMYVELNRGMSDFEFERCVCDFRR